MRYVWLILISLGLSVALATPAKGQRTFRLPEVPVMLNTPEARAAYVCEHYWDHFDFADTVYIHLQEITEQAIVNFMDLMPRVPQEVSGKAMTILYTRAAPHSRMLWYFWETMTRYWSYPDSPLRNEDMFIEMCRQVEALSSVENVLRQRATFLRNLAEKNRVGQPAEDFVYTLVSGKTGRLSEVQTPYTLLLFYNPDCHTCAEVKRSMAWSAHLSALVKAGKVAVLAVYPDEDLDLWKEHASEIPSDWLNAYDAGQQLTRNDLYDLRSIPSLYLLDKDKKVLLKDTSWEEVREYLREIH